MSFTEGFAFAALLLTIVVVTWMIFSSIRNRIVFTISLRNFYRRRSTTILVIIGSLVGTALITGSQVLNDSFNHTAELSISRTLGEIDVEINNQFGYFSESQQASIRAKLQEIDEVDEVAFINSSQAAIQAVKKDGSGLFQESVSVNAANWDKLNGFGSQSGSNLSVSEPIDGRAVISEPLATKLELKRGDKIILYVNSAPFELQIERVITTKGVSGYTSQQSTGNILINIEEYTAIFKSPEQSFNTVLISHRGGVEPTEYDPKQFAEEIENKIGEIDALDGVAKVVERKDVLRQRITGNGTGVIFTALSIFGIFAGSLLIVNLYTMLAEERKSEIGILRAIAFTRSRLVKAYSYEGFFYAFTSSLAGVLLGIGIGYLLVLNISNVLNQFLTTFGVDVRIFFDVTLYTLLISFCVGFLITYLSIIISSWLISRVNIVSAIRGTKEELHEPHIVVRAIKYLVIGYIMFQGLLSYALAGVVQEQLESLELTVSVDGYMWFLGFVMMILPLSYLLTHGIRKVVSLHYAELVARIVYSASSVAVFLYTTYAMSSEKFQETINSNPAFFFLIGITLVLATSIFITYNLETILWIFNFLLSPMQRFVVILKIALRYPAERRNQTGMTLTMYALILFMIVFISIYRSSLSTLLEENKRALLGGFDALITVTNPENESKVVEIFERDSDVKSVIVGHTVLAVFPEEKIDFGGNQQFNNQATAGLGSSTKYSDAMFIGDEEFFESLDIKIAEVQEGLNKEQLWDELTKNPNGIVITSIYTLGIPGVPKWKVGDKVQLKYPESDELFEKEILAIVGDGLSASFPYGNILTTESGVVKDLGAVPKKSDIQVMVTLPENQELSRIKELKKELAKTNEFGVVFAEEFIIQLEAFFNQFIVIIQGFLSFGLLVGLAGIAVIMMRSVNERRQQIGMLRSLGFTRGMIVVSFLTEASLIGLLGIFTGVFAGSVGGIKLIDSATNKIEGFQISYPTNEILLMVLFVYFATLIFTIIPAIRAGALEPIEATSYQE